MANSPEFAEKVSFSAFIAASSEAELLCEDKGGCMLFNHRLMTPLADAELLLSAEASQTIRRMAGAAGVAEAGAEPHAAVS